MRLRVAILGAMFSASLVFAPVGATVLKPGFEVLEAYSDLQPDQVAAVGRVVSVTSVEMIGSNGIRRVYPEIRIEIEESLFGNVTGSMDIIGFNVFYKSGGEWLTKSIMGAPWFVPDDRIIFVAQEAPMTSVKDGVQTYYRLRTAAFILDDDPHRDNQLYDYQSARPGVDLAVKPATLTQDVILRSLVREPVVNEMTIADIRNAIANGADHE